VAKAGQRQRRGNDTSHARCAGEGMLQHRRPLQWWGTTRCVHLSTMGGRNLSAPRRVCEAECPPARLLASGGREEGGPLEGCGRHCLLGVSGAERRTLVRRVRYGMGRGVGEAAIAILMHSRSAVCGEPSGAPAAERGKGCCGEESCGAAVAQGLRSGECGVASWAHRAALGVVCLCACVAPLCLSCRVCG